MYQAPPAQDKLDPGSLKSDELLPRLQARSGGSFSRALSEEIRGLSRQGAEEIAARVREGGETWPEDLPGTCARLEDLFRRLPEMAAPCVLRGEDGSAEDVFPFLYLSRDTGREEPCKTLSHALDLY